MTHDDHIDKTMNIKLMSRKEKLFYKVLSLYILCTQKIHEESNLSFSEILRETMKIFLHS